MKITVISLFPEMLEQAGSYGVLGRAIKQQQLKLRFINPRDFTTDRHRTVDDRPYGGGPGMLMKVEPLARAIQAARHEAEKDGSAVRVIYLSPQGKLLQQADFVAAAAESETALILIAGRYEGIDERLIETLIDEEWSIGDYVLSGGEYAALVVIDAITRLLPGALGHDESAQQDSFMQGLLDSPHYTRPECIDGREVPRVLLSGDHRAIQRWRLKQALGKTWLKRPDLLDRLRADSGSWDEEKADLLAEFQREYRQDGIEQD